MSLVENLFEVSLEQLELTRLRSFFGTESVETDSFESKSVSDDRIKGADYAEDVAAFLNTNGGLLLVGGPKLTWIDPGDRSRGRRFEGTPTGHRAVARDQLRDAVLGRIEPVPAGVRFRSWELRPQREITLLEVPKSAYPPHQVAGRYFIRLDGATRPAPHGFVEALFRQRQAPRLALEWEKCRIPDTGDVQDILLRARLKNLGNASALAPTLVVFVPYPNISIMGLQPASLQGGEDTLIWLDLDGRPLHPQQAMPAINLLLRGIPAGPFWFEVAFFCQNTPGRYAAYSVARLRADTTDFRRQSSWEVELAEEDWIGADQSDFPYWSQAMRVPNPDEEDR